ncbi:MAG: hypothetical protein GY794_08625, partial [bacterium]|nr:hypothetical protein [bacterium]
MTTTNSYLPFSIADETYLRWQGTGTKTQFGRLYDLLDGKNLERSMLTTMNSSRSLLRSPVLDAADPTSGTRVDLSKITSLDTDEAKNKLYDQILRITGDSNDKAAAYLTANIWAAISPYNAAKAFAFTPSGATYTVFGIQEQPFITEAFATHTTRSPDPNDATVFLDNWKWGAAIELMNFSSTAINLANYKLDVGAASLLSLSGTIPANGGRLTLYDFGAGDAATTAANIFVTMTGTWTRVTGLNFDGGTIRLVRVAETNNIPLDRVVAGAAGDMVYTRATTSLATSTDSPIQILSSNCRRDDVLANHRYSLAAHVKTGPTATAGHKLGAANSAAITVKDGFRIKVPHSLLTGPGEISDLYLVGPILDGGTPNELPRLLVADYATGTNESRGWANSLVVNGTIVPGGKFPRMRGATKIPWPLSLG